VQDSESLAHCPMAGLIKHGKGLAGFIKGVEFICPLTHHQRH